jgi:predicted dehydrogenase
MINVGIIGAGDVVRVRHLPILTRCFADRINVSGVCTRRDHVAREVSSLLGYGVPQFASYHELLDSNPDCVLVAVPTGQTERVCSDSLARSIPTYSEKPMAQSCIGALRLRELAARQQVPYLIGENFYFQGRFEAAERWIAERGAESREIEVDDRLRRGGRENPRCDVDLIWEHLPHPLNAARRIAGRPLTDGSVSAVITRGPNTTAIALKIRNGGSLRTSVSLRIQEEWSQDDYTIVLDRGPAMRISHRYDFATVTYTDVLAWDGRSATFDLAECGIRACWEAFVAALDGTAPEIAGRTIDLALEGTQLIEAARLSADTNGIPVPVIAR